MFTYENQRSDINNEPSERYGFQISETFTYQLGTFSSEIVSLCTAIRHIAI